MQRVITYIQTNVWQDKETMKTLLFYSAVFLFVSVLTAALCDCVWRKAGGRRFRWLKLSRSQFELAVAISIAVPVLAIFLQSIWVFSQGTRLDTAVLWRSNMLDPALWIVIGVEALITFLLLWFFMKVALWFRWPVLLLCLLFWTYFLFEIMAATKGYA